MHKVIVSIPERTIGRFWVAFLPLFQNESWCETIQMHENEHASKTNFHIWKVFHQDSLWNNGTKELENSGLF